MKSGTLGFFILEIYLDNKYCNAVKPSPIIGRIGPTTVSFIYTIK